MAFRAYFQLCIQESLLMMLRGWGCRGSNTCWPHARQAPSLLSYLSSPIFFPVLYSRPVESKRRSVCGPTELWLGASPGPLLRSKTSGDVQNGRDRNQGQM